MTQTARLCVDGVQNCGMCLMSFCMNLGNGTMGKTPLEKSIPPALLILRRVHAPPVIAFGRFVKIAQTGPKPQK